MISRRAACTSFFINCVHICFNFSFHLTFARSLAFYSKACLRPSFVPQVLGKEDEFRSLTVERLL